MATHGTEREAQRHRDYIKSEVISIGERLREVEEKLNAASRRLMIVERQLTEQHGSVQSDANDHTGG